MGRPPITQFLSAASAMALLVVACGGDAETSADAVGPAPGVVAGTDMSKASVPLDQIVFDLFDDGQVSLPEASAEQIASLEDAIPPIDEPRYDHADDGAWLDDEDLVIGYLADSGEAVAYPHKILNLHQIVNDTVDGVPVLVSYCPLCRSGVVYDRRLDDQQLTFGNTSALYENDLVMIDRQTRSYWWQVAGTAIVGELTGAELVPLPSTTTTWSEWLAQHPDTRVLSRDLGFGRNYDRDPFADYAKRVDAGRTPFPVSDEAIGDRRLSPATVVLGVEVEGRHRAYPVEQRTGSVIQEQVGHTQVAVLVGPDGGATAFEAGTADTRALTFAVDAQSGGTRFIDDQTGSTWDLAGRAVAGELVGRRLVRMPSRSTFWFAYVAAFPDTTVWRPRG